MMGYVSSSHESRNIPSESSNHEGRLHLSKIAILPSKALESSHLLKTSDLFFPCCNGLSHQGSIGHFLIFFGGFNLTQEICDSDKWQCFSCNC